MFVYKLQLKAAGNGRGRYWKEPEMKKPFLISLATAIAALSQPATATSKGPSGAALDPVTTSNSSANKFAAQLPALPGEAQNLSVTNGANLFDFVIRRSTDGVLLADHYSHSSHASHSSHRSHYSGY